MKPTLRYLLTQPVYNYTPQQARDIKCFIHGFMDRLNHIPEDFFALRLSDVRGTLLTKLNNMETLDKENKKDV